MLSRASVFFGFNIVILFLVAILSVIGFAALYSAGDGISPWAGKHIAKVLLCGLVMAVVAKTRTWLWFRYAHYIYAVNCLILLLMYLNIIGDTGDVNRWISLWWISVQPSEFAKITTTFAIAKIFHDAREDVTILTVLKAIIVVAIPVYLIFSQPDLGTAMLVLLVAAVTMWCSLIPRVYFAIGAIGILACLPFIWQNLKDYQKERLFSFLSYSGTEYDESYHAIQSKIAIGSGGWFGKGFMDGTQNRLGFMPVKESDFIFTIICEELGIVFAIFILLLYASFIAIGLLLSVIYSDRVFSSLIMVGLSFNVFCYVFVNIGMVTGILPVVGVPLPLISYGGSSTLAIMFTAGIFIAVHSQLGIKVSK